jgi:hypothetical protein
VPEVLGVSLTEISCGFFYNSHKIETIIIQQSPLSPIITLLRAVLPYGQKNILSPVSGEKDRKMKTGDTEEICKMQTLQIM